MSSSREADALMRPVLQAGFDRIRCSLIELGERSAAMTCPATLADKGRVPCITTTPHQPHRGCVYQLPEFSDAVHHDHIEEDR